MTQTATERRPSAGYRVFLSGQVLSGVGNWVYRTALPYILLRDGRSGLALGVVTGAGMLALVLLTPYASTVADRIDALRLCIRVNLALGIIFAGFFGGYLLWGGNLGLILLAVLLAGTVTAFEAPARQRFLPELVGLQRWPSAIVATGMIYNVSRFAGPLLAVAMISTVGPATCIAINSVSFFVAAGTLVALRHSLVPVPAKKPDRSGWLAAMRVCMRDRDFAVAVIAFLVVSLVAINEQVTIPLLSASLYGDDATRLSALLSAVAAGALGSGLLLLKYRRLSSRAFTAAILALAVCNAGLLVPRSFAALLVLAALAGAVIGALTSIANVLIQTGAPLEYRARAFATFYLLMFGTTAAGAPLSGELADLAGARSPFAVSAVVCAVVGGWLLARSSRATRTQGEVRK
ncbi:MFS transporter [Actinomadura sp. DC4]|uniref:MFS transporter n=1 Tax=Actinomadura sp. DC4 TaxID=3055069 RepID=UPI0025AF986D|nr:MFS transporter [Actinomadura sp. DC4]MDN3355650.1 MFS transporter [Actinomadura sp. DC4]